MASSNATGVLYLRDANPTDLPTTAATTVWSIRELNDLFETHGGTVALQPGEDASFVVVTLTLPDGRRLQTEWEPAFHAFGFGLPVVRAFYFGAEVAA